MKVEGGLTVHTLAAIARWAAIGSWYSMKPYKYISSPVPILVKVMENPQDTYYFSETGAEIGRPRQQIRKG
jgi:hypothetical protein